MNRGGGGVDIALETISAAATAIAAAENRNPQPTTVQKKRWGGSLSLWGCFGSQKHRKRITDAVLVPVPAAVSENPVQVPSTVLPVVAPPSSPASLLTSEAPSATQSPSGGLSLTAISAIMNSSDGPASMFTIGPYAHETQLVTPPTFSNFNTEPSTAPFTPPPESVHMTTPSSPEVPFACLLDPVNENSETEHVFPFSPDEFQSYLLQPGSPAGCLISPHLGISSPVPDIGNDMTPEAAIPGYPTKVMLFGQYLDATSLAKLHNPRTIDETVVDNRVSFELTSEEVRKCVEKKPATVTKGVYGIFSDDNKFDLANGNHTYYADETSCDSSNSASIDGEIDQEHKKHRSNSKEFNFGSIDGVIGDKGGAGNSWSFFPVTQSGFR